MIPRREGGVIAPPGQWEIRMTADSIIQNTLRLVAVSLGRGDYGVPDLRLWPEIRKELEAQAVLPLVSDFVVCSDICDEWKTALIKRTAASVRAFHQLMSEQSALLELLESQRIPAVILKGAAAGQYYPRPALREYGDIDLLVLPEDFDRACALLSVSGYEQCHGNNVRHRGFRTPGGKVAEVHLRFSGGYDAGRNALSDGWLYEKMGSVRKVTVEGYQVPVFPPLENGLVLLSHIALHLNMGLGLRQIIDWMMYVRAVLDDAFWKEQFEVRAEAVGMAVLAKTVTRMCQVHLGLEERITWCADADEELVDELIVYIFAKGNFGHKIGGDSLSTIAVMHSLANPVTALRYLTEAGMYHLAEAGRTPRKAYAWIYQMVRLVRITLKRGDKNRLAGDIRCGVREAGLLRRLI